VHFTHSSVRLLAPSVIHKKLSCGRKLKSIMNKKHKKLPSWLLLYKYTNCFYRHLLSNILFLFYFVPDQRDRRTNCLLPNVRNRKLFFGGLSSLSISSFRLSPPFPPLNVLSFLRQFLSLPFSLPKGV